MPDIHTDNVMGLANHDYQADNLCAAFGRYRDLPETDEVCWTSDTYRASQNTVTSQEGRGTARRAPTPPRIVTILREAQ
jgi:hypothetical protein